MLLCHVPFKMFVLSFRTEVETEETNSVEPAMDDSEYTLSFYLYCVPEEDFRCKVAMEMKQVVPVVMLCIGILGNSLNVVVLSRRKFRNHPFLIGLMVLSVSDTLQLLLNVLSVHVIQKLDSENMYKYCKYDCLAVICQGTFAYYILAILTLERTFFVRYPNVHRDHVTRRNYIIVLFVVIAVIIMFHAFLIFGGNKDVIQTDGSNTTLQSTIDRLDCMIISFRHSENYRPVLVLTMLFFDYFTPFCIVCIGNILIIRAVKQSRARVSSDPNRENLTQNTATKIAKTVCVFFFVSASPLFVSKTVQEVISVSADIFPTTSLIDMVLFVVVQCNFAFNFILYFWTGSVFRDEFKKFVNEVKMTLKRYR